MGMSQDPVNHIPATLKSAVHELQPVWPGTGPTNTWAPHIISTPADYSTLGNNLKAMDNWVGRRGQLAVMWVPLGVFLFLSVLAPGRRRNSSIEPHAFPPWKPGSVLTRHEPVG